MTKEQINILGAISDGDCVRTIEMDASSPGALPEKRCYTVEDLQIILCCGRETVYSLLKKNEFRWFRVGGKGGAYRISKRSFDSWLDNML